MNQKRWFITGIVVLVLCALAYLQFRQWRHFNWSVFFVQLEYTNKRHIVAGIALIYLSYILRSVRWKLFLRPVKQTSAERLIAPQLIGFTGLALLGRPGEFVRPYLIARKEGLTFSSQVAVWTVERIFDMGAFALLVALTLAFAPSVRALPYYQEFKKGGAVVSLFVVFLALAAFATHRWGGAIASWLQTSTSWLPANLVSKIAYKIRSFRDGLNTIHDLHTFLELVVISLGLWLLIALAYRQITHAFYIEPLRHFTISHVLVLMGFSIVGSTVQLPVVGGGSQLLTIAALAHVFRVPGELAVSCGILLWLTTFMSVIPAGLLLAHREHVSIRQLSAESHHAEEAQEQLATGT